MTGTREQANAGKEGRLLRPLSLLDIGLCGLTCAALVATWHLGDFHARHHSDTVIPTLSSLYNWTPFFWEQDRQGSLYALLASPITRPYANLLTISLLSSLSLIGALALWGGLLGREVTLTESSFWAALVPASLAVVGVAALAVNAAAWNLASPAWPLARLEGLPVP